MTQKWHNDSLTISLDLQLQKRIFVKVKSFQTDKHCRQINWTEKGAKRPMIVLIQEEKNKHCCRCFCQNCEWHSKVVVRGEKNKKCIVPTTSTANKELCFTGVSTTLIFLRGYQYQQVVAQIAFPNQKICLLLMRAWCWRGGKGDLGGEKRGVWIWRWWMDVGGRGCCWVE